MLFRHWKREDKVKTILAAASCTEPSADIFLHLHRLTSAAYTVVPLLWKDSLILPAFKTKAPKSSSDFHLWHRHQIEIFWKRWLKWMILDAAQVKFNPLHWAYKAGRGVGDGRGPPLLNIVLSHLNSTKAAFNQLLLNFYVDPALHFSRSTHQHLQRWPWLHMLAGWLLNWLIPEMRVNGVLSNVL